MRVADDDGGGDGERGECERGGFHRREVFAAGELDGVERVYWAVRLALAGGGGGVEVFEGGKGMYSGEVRCSFIFTTNAITRDG